MARKWQNTWIKAFGIFLLYAGFYSAVTAFFFPGNPVIVLLFHFLICNACALTGICLISDSACDLLFNEVSSIYKGEFKRPGMLQFLGCLLIIVSYGVGIFLFLWGFSSIVGLGLDAYSDSHVEAENRLREGYLLMAWFILVPFLCWFFLINISATLISKAYFNLLIPHKKVLLNWLCVPIILASLLSVVIFSY